MSITELLNKKRILLDEHGTYIIVNGLKYRPTAHSRYLPGGRVRVTYSEHRVIVGITVGQGRSSEKWRCVCIADRERPVRL